MSINNMSQLIPTHIAKLRDQQVSLTFLVHWPLSPGKCWQPYKVLLNFWALKNRHCWRLKYAPLVKMGKSIPTPFHSIQEAFIPHKSKLLFACQKMAVGNRKT